MRTVNLIKTNCIKSTKKIININKLWGEHLAKLFKKNVRKKAEKSGDAKQTCFKANKRNDSFTFLIKEKKYLEGEDFWLYCRRDVCVVGLVLWAGLQVYRKSNLSQNKPHTHQSHWHIDGLRAYQSLKYCKIQSKRWNVSK